MTITKELLLKRRQDLLNNYNALAGALQDVDYWLSVLEPSISTEEPTDMGGGSA
jgi:hypothetical protein